MKLVKSRLKPKRTCAPNAASCGLLAIAGWFTIVIATGTAHGANVAADTHDSLAVPSNPPAVAKERVVYELGRIEQYDNQPAALALALAVAIAIALVVGYLYRRDTVEVSRSVGATLALLRIVALGGMFVFFLGIERRATREVVHNSQVAILVDVSQSMGLADGDQSSGVTGPSRLDAVVDALADSSFLEQLRHDHDVNIARFDEQSESIATLPKLQLAPGERQAHSAAARDQGTTKSQAESAKQNSLDWQAELQPRGTETRLGQALGEQLRLFRDAPLAGLVVITDGAQNAGVEPSAAVATAKEAKVPIYTIGVGSAEPQKNIAISDLVLPSRAFPGDMLNVTGFLQANGYAGQLVEVELLRRGVEDATSSGTRVAAERVVVGADGDITSVSFDLEPNQPGTFVYQLRVHPLVGDANARDNSREAEVNIVDRQTRVLLFASGPMRDYHFLRDQLNRDKSMTVDVLLQTAQPGMSQDANEILASFPSTKEDLYKYDCIVAFDPDWTQLDAQQIDLLESWIADEAGGLIAVAGPIYTGKWVRSAEHSKLRDLYPVVFQQRLTLLDDGQYSSETPWPLEFERAGREARFLWLGQSAEESAAAWDAFPGIYGYYAVKSEKPGATVYARFSDPEAGLGDRRPVYLAGQFYGSGQTIYLGSGELWRLRAIDPAYFEVLTTKLIRQASQGRILRGSARGSLLVERDRYELGETVVLRARLADAQHNPLTEPTVTAQVLRPDGNTEAVKLSAETDRPGMYVGQMPVLSEGTYHVSLPIADAAEESLSRYLQVRVPDRERTRAQRNDALLSTIASETGGKYYTRLSAAVSGAGAAQPLSEVIVGKSEVKLLKGAPDQQFARQQMQWLLGVIAGALFLEWTVRRLNRLA